jgi:hypothetical protein
MEHKKFIKTIKLDKKFRIKCNHSRISKFYFSDIIVQYFLLRLLVQQHFYGVYKF